MRICRVSNYIYNEPTNPKLTDRAILLSKWSKEFYMMRNGYVQEDLLFMQMGVEMVWQYADFGFSDVFYPMNRLPWDLEKYLEARE